MLPVGAERKPLRSPVVDDQAVAQGEGEQTIVEPKAAKRRTPLVRAWTSRAKGATYGRNMSLLDDLDWSQVRSHYDDRVAVHRRLLKFHDANPQAFAQLLLGVSDSTGNFSAAEHNLGPKILSNPNALERIGELATNFRTLKTARPVPGLIRKAALAYLKIGVGSEASCLMNPGVCWVANTRTIWTHLVIKHADNIGKANEELKLYRDSDPSSEMAYKIWCEIHRLLETSMTRIAEEGKRRGRVAGVEPGEIMYLWADAIANELYAQHQ